MISGSFVVSSIRILTSRYILNVAKEIHAGLVDPHAILYSVVMEYTACKVIHGSVNNEFGANFSIQLG